jgi:hypothetical protein
VVRLTLTLANGTVITDTVTRMPRHWKSHLMQLAPYTADYIGATWQRERISPTETWGGTRPTGDYAG